MQEICKIFYSWQSDVKESRNMLSDCLKRVPSKLKDMVIVEISRDTEGIAGAPNIGDTIYDKIDNADIFFADVSIINADYNGRKTPNPNVLIELGYAIKSLGWEHIILVYNSDTGDVEQLPFDINHQRMTAYSIKEESKTNVREKIIKSVSRTIEILQEKHLLHGGQPGVVKARKDLSNVIFEAMKSVQLYYVKRHFGKADEKLDDFIPVSDVYLQKLEALRECLLEQEYYEISKLLHRLQLVSTGSAEACGWEYAEEIAERYFDEIYRTYGEYMLSLPLESVVTEEFVILMNAIAADTRYFFCKERYLEDKLVFINDGHYQEAYDSNGNLLCKGVIENNFFTGFRATREYIGEYTNSKRNGYGKELTNLFYKLRYGCGEYRKDGKWEEDKFIEGIVYSAVLTKCDNGDYICEIDSNGDVMTADSRQMADFIHSLEIDELEKLCFADMILKNGEYDVCEGTVRDASDYDNVKYLLTEKE